MDDRSQLKEEYDSLKTKYVKLNTFIYGQELKGSNEGIGNTSLMTLKFQRNAMKRYLDILEKRCCLEGIEV